VTRRARDILPPLPLALRRERRVAGSGHDLAGRRARPAAGRPGTVRPGNRIVGTAALPSFVTAATGDGDGDGDVAT